MITIKNKDLTPEVVDTFNYLLVKKLPIQEATIIAKAVRKISQRLEEVNQKKHLLADKYVVKDEKGQPVLAKDEQGNPIPNRYTLSDPQGYHAEMNVLLEQTVEIPTDKINVKSLTGVDIEPNRVLIINWLFTDFD